MPASAQGERQGISAHNARIPEFPLVLELILKDGQLNVHAGEVDVRPPPAPTTRALSEALPQSLNP